jgi:hypothetical protein
MTSFKAVGMAGTWPGSQGSYNCKIPLEEIKQGHSFAALTEPLPFIDPSLRLRIDTLATRNIMQLDMTAILRTWPHVGMRYG